MSLPYYSVRQLAADAVYDRLAAALSVEVLYRGNQADGSDYVLIERTIEREADDWSHKATWAGEFEVNLMLFGANPRTLMARAKTIIDDLVNNADPLSVSGFSQEEVFLDANRGMRNFTGSGQRLQYSRAVDIRFIFIPSSY